MKYFMKEKIEVKSPKNIIPENQKNNKRWTSDIKATLLLVMAIFFVLHSISAQRNEILNPRIASLQVSPGDDWLQPPIIQLHGGQPIIISFDDLTHEYHRYVYRVEHCEADWSPSRDLFTSEYVQGFADGKALEDLEESLNTNILFTHYRLQIPNEECRLKLSGNYRVTIYDENNDNEEVLRAYFLVVDPIANVMLNITSNTDLGMNSRYQQLSAQVRYNNLKVTRPDVQLHTVALQNFRWDDARYNAAPQYRMSDGLKWDHCRQLIFYGGNEYRKFEMTDPDHATLGIEKMRWDGTSYHAWLWPDEPRPNYVYDEDANGAFYIRNSDNYDNDRLSDYVLVHFTLKSPRLDGDVYVNGRWTHDQLLPEYRMDYDDLKGEYSLVKSMKLGYYNYQYLLQRPDGNIEPLESEGTFYQTENQYQFLVYWRAIGGRTDLLVGYQQVSFAP